MNLLNTHNYDGKLKPLSEELNNILKNQDREDVYDKLEKLLSDHAQNNKIQSQWILFFKCIVNDKYNVTNYDNTNKMSAYDLLYLIGLNINIIDMTMIIEQLEDMKTGNCPQGRVIRLYHILETFLETFLETL